MPKNQVFGRSGGHMKESSQKKSNIKWLWQQCKGSRLSLGLLPVVSFFMSICYLLITMIFQGFMDIAAGDSENTFYEMIVFSIVSIVLYALTQILSSVLEGYTYSKLEKRIRISLIQKILQKQLLDIQKMHTGEILNRLTSDVANVSEFYIQVFGQICLSICTSLLATIYLFILNWKMAILFLIIIPLLTFLISVFTPKLRNIAKLDSKNEDNNRSNMQEILSRLTLFQAYSMEQAVDCNIDMLYEKKKSSKIKLSILEGSMAFLNSMVTFCVFIIASGVGAYFVLKGQNQVGDLVAMIQLSNYIMLPLSTVPKWMSIYNVTATSIKRIEEIEELPDRPYEIVEDATFLQADKIELKQLKFSYNEQKLILDQVDAIFGRGDITAIIGESGSGKTTLLLLILGIYQPENERMIQIYEKERCYPFFGGVKNIAYVPSENFVYRGTVRDNICMSLKYEKNKFENACGLANIDKLIQNFKYGEEEIIEENGNNLSMGQKQRIAIARALYAATPVILFDEPTANLDPDSVEIFKKMIEGISRDKICIIVTHDMNVATICNRIYKLEKGALSLQAD